MALIDRAMPGMRERGFGRVVNVASSAVREPIPVLMLSNSHRSATLAAFKIMGGAMWPARRAVFRVDGGAARSSRLSGTRGQRRLAEPPGTRKGQR